MKQSISGYIRQHLQEIEQKISIGIRHESIVEEIKKSGIKIDLSQFRTYLYRARKSAKSISPEIIKKTVQQSDNQKPSNQVKKEETAKNPNKTDKPSSFAFKGSTTYSEDQLI